MPDTQPADAATPGFETESPLERTARVQREAALIAKAHADIDAGLGIEDDDAEAWLDALDHDENTPLPRPQARVA